MIKHIAASLLLLCIGVANAQPNNDEAEFVGKWRVFASPQDVTSVLRSEGNDADMDLFCDASHFEISVYLKKQQQEGYLKTITLHADDKALDVNQWQSNHRTRSTTVKTLDKQSIDTLLNSERLMVSYELENTAPKEVIFDLSDIKQIYEKANAICKIDKV